MIAQAFGMSWDALKAGVLADPGLVARIAETWGTADEKVKAGTQVEHGALGGVGQPGQPGQPGQSGQAAFDQRCREADRRRRRRRGTAMNRSSDGLGRQESRPTDAVEPKRPRVLQAVPHGPKQRKVNAQEFASQKHGMQIDKVTDFQHRVEDLKTDPGMQIIMGRPNAYKAALDWIRKRSDSTEAQLANAFPDTALYPPEVKTALAEIQLLRSQKLRQRHALYRTAILDTEVQNVSKGMDQLLNIEFGQKDYNDGARSSDRRHEDHSRQQPRRGARVRHDGSGAAHLRQSDLHQRRPRQCRRLGLRGLGRQGEAADEEIERRRRRRFREGTSTKTRSAACESHGFRPMGLNGLLRRSLGQNASRQSATG